MDDEGRRREIRGDGAERGGGRSDGRRGEEGGRVDREEERWRRGGREEEGRRELGEGGPKGGERRTRRRNCLKISYITFAFSQTT